MITRENIIEKYGREAVIAALKQLSKEMDLGAEANEIISGLNPRY